MSQLKVLKEEFIKVSKRVLKKKLSTNPVTLLRYEKDLMKSYNDILNYINVNVNILKSEQEIEVQNIIKELRHRLVQCFGNLGVTIVLEAQLLKPITEENILERPYPTEPLSSTVHLGSEALIISSDSEEDEFFDTEVKILKNINDSLKLLEVTFEEEEEKEEVVEHTGTKNIFSIATNNNNTGINMDPTAVIGLISKILSNNFSGNPLELDAFLNSIELIQTVVGTNHPGIVLHFIKSKLVGKALEAIPTGATSILEITTALKDKIKPENSKVIAGKMMALRADNKNKTEFAKVAEELAEAFKRASIVEGIPQVKSSEMAIDETVKMCRNNAKTDLVKGILAASKFESPGEVIAKYLVESTNEVQEKQILAYRAIQRQNNRGYNNNNNNRGNNRGRRGFNNNYGNGNYGYNNNFNRNNSNRYNNYNNNNSNNGRGRGYNSNYRGNNRGNYRGNYNRGNNSNNYDNNDRNIRYAENSEGPSRISLGGVNNNNNNGQNHNNNEYRQ